MLEEIASWFPLRPDAILTLGIVGVLLLFLVFGPLLRPARRRFGRWLSEISLIKRIRGWFGENPETIPLGIGVLCLLASVALLATPIRLIMHGASADGVVTDVTVRTHVDEKGQTSLRTTARLRFRAGHRDIEIQRHTSSRPGGICIVGCYSKGEKVKILYLAEDPNVAEIQSILGLFGGPLMLGFAGALAILIWRLWRSDRSANAGRMSG